MKQDQSSGLLLALAGFALLSVGDGVVKTMADAWSPVAVAALRFTIGAVGLSIILALREGRAAFRPANPWLQLARGVCMAMATMFFFSAIFVMPLADAMAIAFVAPILTAIFGGLLLRETIAPVTWIVSAVALAGVMLILRPNLAELGWPAVLPLISATFFSLMIVANRASAGRGSALSMQVFVATLAAPILTVAAFAGRASGIDAMDFGWPDWSVVARCGLVAITASLAHWLIYLGTERAGAGRVAPAIYVQILIAAGLGWWWFGDVPDAMTAAGAALIISAGLYLWRDSTRQRPVPETVLPPSISV